MSTKRNRIVVHQPEDEDSQYNQDEEEEEEDEQPTHSFIDNEAEESDGQENDDEGQEEEDDEQNQTDGSAAAGEEEVAEEEESEEEMPPPVKQTKLTRKQPVTPPQSKKTVMGPPAVPGKKPQQKQQQHQVKQAFSGVERKGGNAKQQQLQSQKGPVSTKKQSVSTPMGGGTVPKKGITGKTVSKQQQQPPPAPEEPESHEEDIEMPGWNQEKTSAGKLFLFPPKSHGIPTQPPNQKTLQEMLIPEQSMVEDTIKTMMAPQINMLANNIEATHSSFEKFRNETKKTLKSLKLQQTAHSQNVANIQISMTSLNHSMNGIHQMLNHMLTPMIQQQTSSSSIPPPPSPSEDSSPSAAKKKKTPNNPPITIKEEIVIEDDEKEGKKTIILPDVNFDPTKPVSFLPTNAQQSSPPSASLPQPLAFQPMFPNEIIKEMALKYFPTIEVENLLKIMYAVETDKDRVKFIYPFIEIHISGMPKSGKTILATLLTILITLKVKYKVLLVTHTLSPKMLHNLLDSKLTLTQEKMLIQQQSLRLNQARRQCTTEQFHILVFESPPSDISCFSNFLSNEMSLEEASEFCQFKQEQELFADQFKLDQPVISLVCLPSNPKGLYSNCVKNNCGPAMSQADWPQKNKRLASLFKHMKSTTTKQVIVFNFNDTTPLKGLDLKKTQEIPPNLAKWTDDLLSLVNTEIISKHPGQNYEQLMFCIIPINTDDGSGRLILVSEMLSMVHESPTQQPMESKTLQKFTNHRAASVLVIPSNNEDVISWETLTDRKDYMAYTRRVTSNIKFEVDWMLHRQLTQVVYLNSITTRIHLTGCTDLIQKTIRNYTQNLFKKHSPANWQEFEHVETVLWNNFAEYYITVFVRDEDGIHKYNEDFASPIIVVYKDTAAAMDSVAGDPIDPTTRKFDHNRVGVEFHPDIGERGKMNTSEPNWKVICQNIEDKLKLKENSTKNLLHYTETALSQFLQANGESCFQLVMNPEFSKPPTAKTTKIQKIDSQGITKTIFDQKKSPPHQHTLDKPVAADAKDSGSTVAAGGVAASMNIPSSTETSRFENGLNQQQQQDDLPAQTIVTINDDMEMDCSKV